MTLIPQKILDAETDPISIGGMFFSEGKIPEAVQCFEDALKVNPSDVEALNNLGVIAFHLNDTHAAEKLFTKALRLNRRHVDSMINLAEVNISKGRTDRAEHLLRKAKEINVSPNSAATLLKEIGFNAHTIKEKKKEPRILDPKRILVINNLYPPQELGGYGRVIADFADILSKRGHRIRVLTSNTPSLGRPPDHEPSVDRGLLLFGAWTPKGMKEYDRETVYTVIKKNHHAVSRMLESF